MLQPLTSVIVPVYNGEKFISETLDIILAQDYVEKEIIVVDDGSIRKKIVFRMCDSIENLLFFSNLLADW